MITIYTLTQHIDNIFSVLPQTKEVKSLKKEVLDELISLHQQLIDKGYNHNQATSILLAKYGSIEDVLKVKGLHSNIHPIPIPILELDELLNYIALTKHSASLFCIGLSLILFAFPCFSLTKTLLTPKSLSILDPNISCIPALLIFLSFISVGLFIIYLSHTCLSNSPSIVQQYFGLSADSHNYLETGYTTYPIVFSSVIGTLLYLAAPLTLLNLPTNPFLQCCHFFSFCTLMACACSIFIMSATLHFTYKRLLKLDLNH